MAKWASATLLDGGPNVIQTLAATSGRVKCHLIKAYAAADSYATVVSNSVANFNVAAGDVTIANGSSSARVTTFAAKAGVAAGANSGASPNLHVAYVDSTGTAVLFVTDETSDQVITSGNTIDFPAITYTASQPT